MHSPEEVTKGLSDTRIGTAALMAKALLRSGWFDDFRVARALYEAEALEGTTVGWTYKPPPNRDKARRARKRARRPAL